MQVCSMRIGNIVHNESRVYTRRINRSITASGNKNYDQTVNQVSQDELYAFHCVIQAFNNVNPGKLNEIHFCQPRLLYNQFP